MNYAKHSVAHTISILEMDYLDPTYKCLKKKFRSTNNVEYEFWTCHDDIKCERQQKEVYGRLAYSTQYMAGEDRYQSLKRRGVGV